MQALFKSLSALSMSQFISRNFALCVCLLLSACYHFPSDTSTHDVTSTAELQKIVLIDSNATAFDQLVNSETVHRFYSSRHFVPVWIKNQRPSVLADSLLSFIDTCRFYGLLPQRYNIQSLKALRPDSVFFNDNDLKRFDLLLSDAFLIICGDLKSGREPMDSLLLHSRRSKIDSLGAMLLSRVVDKDAISSALLSQEPTCSRYVGLRDEIKRILLSEDGVRKKFFLSGGIDTTETSSQLRSLEINMDRWRREIVLPKRHIFVNIPSFTLSVYEDDTISFHSDVIVGNDKNQTPLLDGLVRHFTIFPSWTVPRSIAVKEILPNLKNDSTYLETHNYNVLDVEGNILDASLINWQDYHRDNFPFMIRQKQGIFNALGLIKFSFRNPYSIYLHDTNAKMMFKKENRALSHGCVRVEKALELGRYLVRDNVVCSPEDLDQYLEMKKQLVINVTEPIPVYLRYYTCEIIDGKAAYYDDVYGVDEKLVAAIYGAEGQQEQKFPESSIE